MCKRRMSYHLAQGDVLPPGLLVHLVRLHVRAQIVHLLEQILIAGPAEGLGCAARLRLAWRPKWAAAAGDLPKRSGWLLSCMIQ